MTIRDRSVQYVARLTNPGGYTPFGGTHAAGTASRVITVSRVTDGVSNPNWRKQIQEGQCATTPFSGSFDSIESNTTEMYVIVSAYDFGCNPNAFRTTLKIRGDPIMVNNYTPDWGLDASVKALAYNRALTSFLKKVHQVETSFQGLTFLGELRESLSMIRKPATGLRNLLGAYIGDVGKAKKRSKRWKQNLGGMYLEYTFGWAPLMGDIQNAYQTYSSLLEKHKESVVKVSAIGIAESYIPGQSGSQLVASLPTTWSPQYYLSRRATEHAFCKIRGAVRQKVHGQLWQDMDLFGFQMKEFIPTAWELLPWSFLIDYFSNIGDVIEASVANTGSVSWANVSEVQKRKLTFSADCNVKSNESGFGCIWGAGGSSTAKYVRKTVQRRSQDTFGMPSLAFEIPGVPRSVSNPWSNMTALLASCSKDVFPQNPRPIRWSKR